MEYRKRIQELAILAENIDEHTPDMTSYKIRLCKKMAALYDLIEKEESN